MSKPQNSAARNRMTPMERQCYDWGWEGAEERIINLLEQDICPDWTVTCCDGACAAYKDAIALIKGEQK